MAHKHRIDLSLESSTVELLKRVGNQSLYITALVEQRWRDWQVALDHLRSAGWMAQEIEAACHCLNGYSATYSEYTSLGMRLSIELLVHERHCAAGIPEGRWAQLRARLRDGVGCDELARALYTVAIEYWYGNEACKRRIERS